MYHETPRDDTRISFPEFHLTQTQKKDALHWDKEWSFAQKIIVKCFENGLKDQFSEEAIAKSWGNFQTEQDPIYYPLLEGMDNTQLARTFVSYWKSAQGMATRSRSWLEQSIARIMVYQALHNDKQVKREIYTREMLRDGMLSHRKPVREIGSSGNFEHMSSSTVWRVELKSHLLDEVDRLVGKQERVPAAKSLPHDPKERTKEQETREQAADRDDQEALDRLRQAAQQSGVNAAPIPISCNLIVVDPNKALNTPSIVAMRYINPRSLESNAQRKQERANILRLYAYLLQEFPEYHDQPNAIQAVAAEYLPRHRLTKFPQRYPKYFGEATYWDAGRFWHYVAVPLPIVRHAVRVAGEALHDMLIGQLSSVLPNQHNVEDRLVMKGVCDVMDALPEATSYFGVGGRPVYLRPRKHITEPDPWVLSDSWDRPARVVSWSADKGEFETSTISTSELLNQGTVLSRNAFEKKITHLQAMGKGTPSKADHTDDSTDDGDVHGAWDDDYEELFG